MDEQTPTVRLPSRQVREDQTKLLYNALTLMRTLTPSFGPRPVRKTNWHRFLDYLSWLCDSKCGGQIVISIAVEWFEGTARFWIATNGPDVDRHRAHLESLLEHLVGIQTASDQALEAATRDIFADSITFNRLRVHDYSRKLRRYMECIEAEVLSVDDRLLIDGIKEMLETRFHQQRCITAYDLRHQDYFRRLSQNAEKDISKRAWYWIRHYIVRLGSWFVASKFVVGVARRTLQLFKQFQVAPVRGIGKTATRILDEDMSLSEALLRTLPGYNSELVDFRTRTMQSASNDDLGARFMENYTDPNFVPKVHAETLMVEHFYFNQLHFFGNDRYIGCSKPSCYCCDLYLRNHPGNFEARPSHGNVWVKWCLPFEADEEDVGKRTHAVKMQKRILININRDLESRLLSGTYEHVHLCDSTTALSRLSVSAPG